MQIPDLSRVALAASFIALGLLGCSPVEPAAEPQAAPPMAGANAIDRGRYLVMIGGCHDCHTPMEMTEQGPHPDMTRELSGHPEGMVMPPLEPLPEPWMWAGAATNTAFYGPWGRSYSMNLTPDENTGIGIWTEEMFLQTMKTGKHMGTSRPIMPPMPWQNLARANDEDLRAIYAYLRSVPAISNRVPDYEPPGGAPPAGS